MKKTTKIMMMKILNKKDKYLVANNDYHKDKYYKYRNENDDNSNDFLYNNDDKGDSYKINIIKTSMMPKKPCMEN